MTDTTRRQTLTVGLAAGMPLGFLVVVVVSFAAAGGPAGTTNPSAAAVSDIPGDYLALYQQAAAEEGIDWAILAGIGKLECDHGRSQLAGCNPPGTFNQAGARGPMQFLGSTWRSSAAARDPDVAGPSIPRGAEARGYATDGSGDGIADPWDPADAVFAAARYLVRNGAPSDYRAAIWAYNHSDAYRTAVLRWADIYRDAAAQSGGVPAGPVELVSVRGITVNAAIAGQVEALLAAAEADGLTLTGSGYRDPQAQIALRRAHCGTSQYAIYQAPASSCSPPTARPGSSMHELGLASTSTTAPLAPPAAGSGCRSTPSASGCSRSKASRGIGARATAADRMRPTTKL